MERQAIVTYQENDPEGVPVHVTYVNENGEEWKHGYVDFLEHDFRREVEEWLNPKAVGYRPTKTLR